MIRIFLTAIISGLIFVVFIHTSLKASDIRFNASTLNNQDFPARITTLAAGTLVAGESLLLLAGMNYPHVSSWSTPRNLLLAGSDIALGSLLVFQSLSSRNFSISPIFYISACILLATHGFREYEYFNNLENPFCTNRALFMMNNIKIGLIGSSLTLAFRLSF